MSTTNDQQTETEQREASYRCWFGVCLQVIAGHWTQTARWRASITEHITNTKGERECLCERWQCCYWVRRQVLLLWAERFRSKNTSVVRRMAVLQWNWTETQQRNWKGEIQGVGTEVWQDAWLSSEDFSSTQKRGTWCCYKRILLTFIRNRTLKHCTYITLTKWNL